MKLQPVHWVAIATGAGVAGFLITRVIGGGQTGGFNAPPKQPAPEDDLHDLLNPHPDHPVICHRDDHHAGYVYTPHRYPRVTGGEITAVIHRGFSPMRVPNKADIQWLIAPPSEVMF
jgi:hypothetical protein